MFIEEKIMSRNNIVIGAITLIVLTFQITNSPGGLSLCLKRHGSCLKIHGKQQLSEQKQNGCFPEENSHFLDNDSQ
jgi:hypothetical protein